MSQTMGADIPKLVQLIEETVSQEMNDPARIISDLRECRQMGVDVLPLDMNRSGPACAIEDGKNIRLGFSLLVAREAQFIEDILAERQQHGPFRSFQDFCERIDLESIPEEFITRCIQIGAFDSVEPLRSRVFLGQKKIMQAVRAAKTEQSTGQISLFNVLQTSPQSQRAALELPTAEEWTDAEMMTHEKAAVGFSFTEYFSQSEDENSPELNVAEPGEEPEDHAFGLYAEEGSATEEAPFPPPTFFIQLSTAKTTEQTLVRLREIIQKYPGNSRVVFEFSDANNNKTHVRTHAAYSVRVSDDLIKEMEATIGEATTRIQ